MTRPSLELAALREVLRELPDAPSTGLGTRSAPGVPMISVLLLSLALQAEPNDDASWAQAGAQEQNDGGWWIGVGAGTWAPIGGLAGGLVGLSMRREGLSSPLAIGATVGVVAGLLTGALLGFGAHKGVLAAKLAVMVPLAIELVIGGIALCALKAGSW